MPFMFRFTADERRVLLATCVHQIAAMRQPSEPTEARWPGTHCIERDATSTAAGFTDTPAERHRELSVMISRTDFRKCASKVSA